MAERYKWIARAYGEDTLNRLRSARVLIVGAGGLGSEIVKSMVLMGFENIEILDLDTIDASNLNRQFLFAKEDVGKPKSVIACKTASEFNPHSKIKAHHGDIRSDEYGKSFFETFDLVINGLDNLEARKHVNRICIATNKPLIESGTRGFIGQVQPIQKGISQCFECTTKRDQQQYAYCTIRAMPTKLVHCVAYAKVLYEHLFGVPEDDDDPTKFAEIKKESEEAKENTTQLAERLYNKVHHTLIKDLLLCKESTWTITPPSPMPLHSELPSQEGLPAGGDVQQTLSPKQQAWAFVHSFVALDGREKQAFDKDDPHAVQFVSSAANLRAHIYHIPMESQFEIKAIAGNIIPAISTTNAIISGTVVLEAIKILQGRIKDCRMTYSNPNPKSYRRKPCIIYPSDLLEPNPQCYICSPQRNKQVVIHIDLSRTSLAFFISNVLQKELDLTEPVIHVNALGCIYDHEIQSNHPKKAQMLSQLGITDGTHGIISDGLHDVELKIVFKYRDTADINSFELEGDTTAESATMSPLAPTATTPTKDDDEILDYVPKKKRRKTTAQPGDAKLAPGTSDAIDVD